MDTNQDGFSRFAHVVSSFDEVRSVMGEVASPLKAKVLDRLDEVCRRFIASSPFVVLASAGADGHIDLSPKGDPAGFVRVLDDRFIALPERPGNRRADTYANLLQNPHVGLIFLIPGKAETLRIGGEARIVRDRDLRESMAIGGRVPEFATVVRVDRALIHCPRCVQRSNLWKPETWGDPSSLPDVAEALVKHAKLDISPEEMTRQAEEMGFLKLY